MVAQGNVAVAFGLVAGAGLATTAGAAIVWCASLAQPRLLAASLGFAAGVMLYVSFAEIFMRKSVQMFESSGSSGDGSYRWATLCFFGGMLAVAILDRIVHLMVDLGARRSKHKSGSSSASTTNLLAHEDQGCARRRQRADVAPPVPVMERQQQAGGVLAAAEASAAGTAGAADVEAGNPKQHAAAAAAAAAADRSSDGDSDSVATPTACESSSPVGLTEPCDAVTGAVVAASCPEVVHDADKASGADQGEQAGGNATTSRTPPAVVEIMESDHHSFMLKKMGVLTGIAIFIHNFPEGLATFVGALADTKVGVGLAVAIAMHNIPEGICVAMPIYYATGSRWKGFLWAFLSGVSEPVGGLMGYLFLDGSNELSYAIVFGLVAGMMVYIAVKELIPTALRYDPQDRLATTAVVAGMVVMATSLLLFTL